jgi:hypothetical protein
VLLVAVGAAGLEPEEYVPAGDQNAVELGERGGEMLGRDVDDRVQRDDPAQRLVREVEGGHRAHVEP